VLKGTDGVLGDATATVAEEDQVADIDSQLADGASGDARANVVDEVKVADIDSELADAVSGDARAKVSEEDEVADVDSQLADAVGTEFVALPEDAIGTEFVALPETLEVAEVAEEAEVADVDSQMADAAIAQVVEDTQDDKVAEIREEPERSRALGDFRSNPRAHFQKMHSRFPKRARPEPPPAVRRAAESFTNEVMGKVSDLLITEATARVEAKADEDLPEVSAIVPEEGDLTIEVTELGDLTTEETAGDLTAEDVTVAEAVPTGEVVTAEDMQAELVEMSKAAEALAAETSAAESTQQALAIDTSLSDQSTQATTPFVRRPLPTKPPKSPSNTPLPPVVRATPKKWRSTPKLSSWSTGTISPRAGGAITPFGTSKKSKEKRPKWDKRHHVEEGAGENELKPKSLRNYFSRPQSMTDLRKHISTVPDAKVMLEHFDGDEVRRGSPDHPLTPSWISADADASICPDRHQIGGSMYDRDGWTRQWNNRWHTGLSWHNQKFHSLHRQTFSHKSLFAHSKSQQWRRQNDFEEAPGMWRSADTRKPQMFPPVGC